MSFFFVLMALFFFNYTPTSHCQSICYLDMRPKAFKYHRQAQVGSCSWHMFTENFSRASLLPPIPPPTIVNYSPPANNKPPDSEQVNLFPPTNITQTEGEVAKNGPDLVRNSEEKNKTAKEKLLKKTFSNLCHLSSLTTLCRMLPRVEAASRRTGGLPPN